MFQHGKWLQEFAESINLDPDPQRILILFYDHMTLCTLNDSFKRRSIGWKLFERLKATPNYGGDKIVVENGRIKTIEGELEQPRGCLACQHTGAH